MSDEIETADAIVDAVWTTKQRFIAVKLIEADRAAIRLDERRKVLREAAEWCASEADRSDRIPIARHALCEAEVRFREMADKEPER